MGQGESDPVLPALDSHCAARARHHQQRAHARGAGHELARRFGVNPAAQRIREWRENPARMVWDLFGATPDHWQADGLAAFADPSKPRIAFQACAGPGKTAELAWMGWN